MTIAEIIRQTTHPMMKRKLKVRTKGTIRKLLNEQGAEGEDVGCGCCAIGTEAQTWLLQKVGTLNTFVGAFGRSQCGLFPHDGLL